MTMTLPSSIAPTPHDTELAQVSSRELAPYVGRERDLTIRIFSNDEESASLVIPVAAFRLFVQTLAEMAQGNAVALLPVQTELTTQEAADLLQVSRPYLVGLLDQGVLPHRKVGTHRRVLVQDVLAFKQQNEARRLAALRELSEQAQELDLGY